MLLLAWYQMQLPTRVQREKRTDRQAVEQTDRLTNRQSVFAYSLIHGSDISTGTHQCLHNLHVTLVTSPVERRHASLEARKVKDKKKKQVLYSLAVITAGRLLFNKWKQVEKQTVSRFDNKNDGHMDT